MRVPSRVDDRSPGRSGAELAWKTPDPAAMLTVEHSDDPARGADPHCEGLPVALMLTDALILGFLLSARGNHKIAVNIEERTLSERIRRTLQAEGRHAADRVKEPVLEVVSCVRPALTRRLHHVGIGDRTR